MKIDCSCGYSVCVFGSTGDKYKGAIAWLPTGVSAQRNSVGMALVRKVTILWSDRGTLGHIQGNVIMCPAHFEEVSSISEQHLAEEVEYEVTTYEATERFAESRGGRI